jgi:hypothetical protein
MDELGHLRIVARVRAFERDIFARLVNLHETLSHCPVRKRMGKNMAKSIIVEHFRSFVAEKPGSCHKPSFLYQPRTP